MLSLLDSLPLGGLLGGGLPALNQLTSYAYLLSHIPGVPDDKPLLAGLAPLADALPINGLPFSNGLALPEGLVSIPSGLPFLGIGLDLLGGFPPPLLDSLMSAGSPLAPLSSLLAPAEPTPALAVLQPLSGFLLF
ncbi:MAG TPA: hypothetical protein VGE70_05515 [Burkholderiaceae bacterium]